MNWWRLPQTKGDGKVAVAPSLLSADFSCLEREVGLVERAGADMLHLDVMDGHFVPNLTFGPLVVEAVRKVTRLTLDAHLMISSPEDYAERFAESGADLITVHVEACPRADEVLAKIGSLGCRRGLALNPETPLDRVLPFLPLVDLLLIMSVHPGFPGQGFMSEAVPKISCAREIRDERKLGFAIQVDGGVNLKTAGAVREAGVDVVVAGTAVFKSDDYSKAIADLRG